MTAAVVHRPRLPGEQQNTLSSFALALAMHALLFGGLSLVVQWRTQPEAPVVAELWGSLPPVEVPAPPPAPPPPAPKAEPEPERPEADIVTRQEKKAPPKVEPDTKKLEEEKKRIEDEKRRIEEEKKRVEAEKQKKLEAERKRAEARLAAEREAQRKADVERLLAQAGSAQGAPQAQSGPAGGARGSAEYAARLVAYIKQFIVFPVPEGTSPQIYAEFEVELLPTGEQARVRLVKPSGLAGYDAAVERAIARANPFPRKPDGTVDRVVTIRFYPVERR
jgi:colicin import membrane protein